jgi:hypothetical protein
VKFNEISSFVEAIKWVIKIGCMDVKLNEISLSLEKSIQWVIKIGCMDVKLKEISLSLEKSIQ